MNVSELVAILRLKPEASSIRKADEFLKDAGKRVDRFASDISKRMSRALNFAAIGAAGGLLAAARDALKFDEALTTLQIATDGAIGNAAQLRGQFLGLSKSTGVAKEELVAAANAYFELTSDAKGALAATETFARVSRASAASMEDVTATAASLREQFKISAPEMEDAFGVLITGGKAGAVGLNNMKTLMTSLSAKFKVFGGAEGMGGLAQLGALFQTTMKDSGNAAEAATNLENLFAKIRSREFELKDIGVILRQGGKAGKGQFKGFLEILAALDKAQKKNPEKFIEKFGSDMQANAAFEALRGRMGFVNELIETSLKGGVVAKDLAIREASGAERAKKAWNDVKIAVAAAFTPERIEAIVRVIQQLSMHLGTVLQVLADMENPVATLIALWAAFKALTLVPLLFQIAKGLTAMTTAAGASIASKGLGGAVGGLLGKAGLVGGAAAAGVGAGMFLDETFGISDKLLGVGDFRDPVHEAHKKKMRAKRAAAGGAAVNVTNNISVQPTPNAAATAREVHHQANRAAQAALAGGR